MTAVTSLLDGGIRPCRGSLTLWLANTAAYERMRADDPANQTRHRFVDRDLNRAWGDDVLGGDLASVEARRARELLPVVEGLDALLDIHSTTYCEQPFLIYPGFARNRALADAIAEPALQVLMPGGQHSGLTMTERGRFGDPAASALAMGVECGTHLSVAAGLRARDVALRFLAVLGVIATDQAPAVPEPRPAPCRYEIRRVFRPRSDAARFVRPFGPFEEVSVGQPIVVDGDETLVAPFDRCTILMPSPVASRGRDMVTLAAPVE